MILMYQDLFKFLKSTIIQLMLSSPPWPEVVSGAIAASRNDSTIFYKLSPFCIRVLTYVMIFSFVINSNMPSHPMTMNSSSYVNFFFLKSGTAIIFYSPTPSS